MALSSIIFPFSETIKRYTIHLFSDGFRDQFGGEKGQKYKSAKFKKFLISIHDYTMDKQHQMLQQEFQNWKGELAQLDDVCVIGVKI